VTVLIHAESFPVYQTKDGPGLSYTCSMD